MVSKSCFVCLFFLLSFFLFFNRSSFSCYSIASLFFFLGEIFFFLNIFLGSFPSNHPPTYAFLKLCFMFLKHEINLEVSISTNGMDRDQDYCIRDGPGFSPAQIPPEKYSYEKSTLTYRFGMTS